MQLSEQELTEAAAFAKQQQMAQQQLQEELQTMLREVKRKMKKESKNELIRIIGALLLDNYALKMQLQEQLNKNGETAVEKEQSDEK